MIYENKKDRHQQGLAAFQLERHINRMGGSVKLIETPEHRRECYDFQIFDGHNMFTGVCEVKDRHISEEKLLGAYKSKLLIDEPRLTSLKDKFFLPTLDNNRSEWTKDVVLLWRIVEDDVCYAINIKDLIDNYDQTEEAPHGYTGNDHGNKPSNKVGILIPISLMERFT